MAGQFLETQGAPFWLDYAALIRHWDAVFGAGSLRLRAFDAALFASAEVTQEVRDSFQIPFQIGKARDIRFGPEPSAETIARGRQLNAFLVQVLATRKRVLPRQLWRQFIAEMAQPGDPIDPASLSKVEARFTRDLKALAKEHDLPQGMTDTRAKAKPWAEVATTRGFRASQYLLAFMWRIDKATRSAMRAAKRQAAEDVPLSEGAKRVMPPAAVRNFEQLRRSPFAPHNRLGAVDEEALAAPFSRVPDRMLPAGSTGNVIVGCMKNEGPYILEWVAYHRAIGIDNFLIYSNGCEDGTDAILKYLQTQGVLQHRNNDDWKGKSPQQFALNRALKEPVIAQADWIAHIDVDEFINVRCGNGTLQDFFDRAPDATNVAMTWRLFGHNGVQAFQDRFVIDQFDTCAPRYCPKPHTAWGFKTMFRNIGAYNKLSCHRPNKPDEAMLGQVKWVNGSGQDMTDEVALNGWRNSKKSIGYDLLQLNHYALRSAESFLIKRQRGRALHVDRSIGLNYWIRMDWSVHRDITIKRNLPRLQAEYDRLLADPALQALHEASVDWHREKAASLRSEPEFRDLFDQALAIDLTETERVAYALALDMET